MLKESMWGYAIIVLGILAVGIIWFFANTTRSDQHNYNLLKETTEAAMLDSLDLAAYRQDGTIRIEEEKFVENLIRRFAENADLSNTYVIEIFDVNTEPPKVSLRVSSKKSTTATGELVEFDMVNNLDAILETKYYAEVEEEASETVCHYKTATGYSTISNCSCQSLKCTCTSSIKFSPIGEVKVTKISVSSLSSYYTLSRAKLNGNTISYTTKARNKYYAYNLMRGYNNNNNYFYYNIKYYDCY